MGRLDARGGERVIALTSVLQRRADVRFRIVAPEAVVVRQSEPEVLVLNELGGRLLERIDGRTPVAALLEALRDEYDVEPGQLEADVLRYLGELVAAGVAEEVAAAQGSGQGGHG